MDHAILDRDGRRAGRVDDLLLESTNSESGRPGLVLKAIVSGPLPRPTARPLRLLARLFYLACGIRNAHPAIVGWDHVEAIDALVHLDVDRDEAGLRRVDLSVLRLVARIPGSARRHEHG